MRRIQSIYYAEGAAPFGEMEMRRGHYMDHAYVNQLAHGTGLFESAWRQSEWYRSVAPAIPEVALDRVSQLIGNAFRTHSYSPTINNKMAWFALTKNDYWVDPRTYRKNENTYWGVTIEGFALAKNDVSGTLRQRTMKRLLARDKVYACVSDVNVDPQRQNQKIGAALLDAALRTFNPNQRPTTYAFAANQGLIAKLGEIGFRDTGSHIRTDLFGKDYPIEEVRLEGNSVREVQGNLHEAYPWLAYGIVSNTIYSKTDTLTLPYA